ncbi:hypothetical protein BG015_003943 [Linnemannia schmuckeri]|uniref:Uncharacterized protein n=1 Tax=Linnemannia schmuckeri TaxID=64567 RepID=A0A9P5V1Q5_9FUNG|nr:hypothetical protein BG015_003943 [Linnemannia schmuckeri]
MSRSRSSRMMMQSQLPLMLPKDIKVMSAVIKRLIHATDLRCTVNASFIRKQCDARDMLTNRSSLPTDALCGLSVTSAYHLFTNQSRAALINDRTQTLDVQDAYAGTEPERNIQHIKDQLRAMSEVDNGKDGDRDEAEDVDEGSCAMDEQMLKAVPGLVASGGFAADGKDPDDDAYEVPREVIQEFNEFN